MKKLIMLAMACLLIPLTGCVTITHKNVETNWDGLGVKLDYKSTVAIDSADIPAFIKAVDKLEKLLEAE